MINDTLRSIISGYRTRALIAGGVGLAGIILGGIVAPDHFFQSYLYGYMVALGIAIGSLAFFMIHVLTGGGWGFTVRRILLAAMHPTTFVLLAVLFVPILFGMDELYPWMSEAAHEHPIVSQKLAYLNLPFFLVRAAIYFAIWTFWAWRLTALDKKLEETGDLTIIGKMQNFSALGLLLLVLSITFATTDWMMSLEPEWFSTIFGVIVLIGYGLAAITIATLLVIKFSKNEPFSSLVLPRPQIVHDLGNLMFGFVILWSYTSFVQYLIIWAGNIAEETPWFLHRQNGGWGWVGVVLILFHFAGPFLLLLSRRVKRNFRTLAIIGVWILAMRLLDMFWYILPSFHRGHFSVHWLDFVAPLGLVGIVMWSYFTQLAKRPLVLTTDPRMAEALARLDAKEGTHHHGTPEAGRATGVAS